MSNATYAGAIIMEVDGRDIEIVSLKPTTTTGRKPVKTMNRQGRVLGYADGVTEHKLSITAAIPIGASSINWDGITKAKITVYSINKNDRRVSYLDCFTVETSEQYEADNEARIDIEMIALHKILE